MISNRVLCALACACVLLVTASCDGPSSGRSSSKELTSLLASTKASQVNVRAPHADTVLFRSNQWSVFLRERVCAPDEFVVYQPDEHAAAIYCFNGSGKHVLTMPIDYLLHVYRPRVIETKDGDLLISGYARTGRSDGVNEYKCVIQFIKKGGQGQVAFESIFVPSGVEGDASTMTYYHISYSPIAWRYVLYEMRQASPKDGSDAGATSLRSVASFQWDAAEGKFVGK